MKRIINFIAITFYQLSWMTCIAAEPETLLPKTSEPITYHIDYFVDYFTDPDYIERFKDAPPDLLHVGKAMPITHLWGPIPLYKGENQYTGGPGNTLDRKNITLLTPEEVNQRAENIRRTLKRYHEIGIDKIVPYISYHTIAGDHKKREGFWKFYDNWEKYSRWAGPKPANDPFDWLAVDKKGKFMPGSCGGYSPDYYAPLHRYMACINHPDWAEWQYRLIRMIAEVGYDGCFVDNARHDECFCKYCKSSFRKFLAENRHLDWLQRLCDGIEPDELLLDSPGTPPELIRRWRLIRSAEHLLALRRVGRKINPEFFIFPNRGNIHECLVAGEHCDLLMFECTFTPGLLAEEEIPKLGESGTIAINVSPKPLKSKRYTHRLDFNDPDNFIEMEADVTLPAIAQVGKSVNLTVRILSAGNSRTDGDAAEDFYFLLREAEKGKEIRLPLNPRVAVGGTGSSRKPKQPPVTYKTKWTPDAVGRYAVSLGFRYTDDGHTSEPRAILYPLTNSAACRTNQPELLFIQHMKAGAIYQAYEARKPGYENAQELALAEMAAFSGGGGFSGRRNPPIKYRTFFKKYPQLYKAWRQTAPAAVLYSYWGPNSLSPQIPYAAPTIHSSLAATHRLYVTLVDNELPQFASQLADFNVIYLDSKSYEMSPVQVETLNDYISDGGRIVLGNDSIEINGRPASKLLVETILWDQADPQFFTQSIAKLDGPRCNLRFALYEKADKLALHAVNYNVHLLDDKKKIVDVPPTLIEVPVPSDWKSAKVQCFDPDAGPKTLNCKIANGTARFTMPKTHVYKVVLLEKR